MLRLCPYLRASNTKMLPTTACSAATAASSSSTRTPPPPVRRNACQGIHLERSAETHERFDNIHFLCLRAVAMEMSAQRPERKLLMEVRDEILNSRTDPGYDHGRRRRNHRIGPRFGFSEIAEARGGPRRFIGILIAIPRPDVRDDRI